MSEEFLLEIFQEEIPARMQVRAKNQLQELFTRFFAEEKLRYTHIASYVTPLRLVLVVEGLQDQQPDQVMEKKGPLLSAPAQAIEGFLRSHGLTDIADCERLETPKGEALLYRQSVPGRATREVLPALITRVMTAFSWPKAMRFADQDFRWIRPLRHIFAVYAGTPLSGNVQLGSKKVEFAHEIVLERLPRQIATDVTDFARYQRCLSDCGIILDWEQRREKIAIGIAEIAQKTGGDWREDKGLLDEVSGLLERVHVLAGEIEDRFMDLPDSVLRLTLRSHQKYFVFNKKDSDSLAPVFAIVTSKSEAGAQEIVLRGNQRVLRARLQDAKFFLAQDQRQSLLTHAEKLIELRFFEGLGSVHDKALRVAKLLSQAPMSLDAQPSRELALQAKADLVSEMVGEFPELQGLIGAHYATQEGMSADIVDALSEQYMPKGPSDHIPQTFLGCGLAMMDKIDSIAGFTSIKNLPTGSGDPFAIRRAMLGVIRIAEARGWLGELPELFAFALSQFHSNNEEMNAILHDFYCARIVQYLRDQGIEANVAQAALDSEISETPALAHALQEFLQTPAGTALRTTYLRAAGILKQADYTPVDCVPKLAEQADQQLWQAVQEVEHSLALAGEIKERFSLLGKLSQPLDNFFETVLINDKDTEIKNSRLYVLNAVLQSVRQVANFGRLISG